MKARTKNGLILAGCLISAAGMIACGAGSSGDTGKHAKPKESFAPTLGATGKAVATGKPVAAVPTIDDGTWVVGEDVPAGTYKVNVPVEQGCYWSITKSGSNGGTIIQNDLPVGGRPKVTIKKGQDFSTQRCGTWTKVS